MLFLLSIVRLTHENISVVAAPKMLNCSAVLLFFEWLLCLLYRSLFCLSFCYVKMCVNQISCKNPYNFNYFLYFDGAFLRLKLVQISIVIMHSTRELVTKNPYTSADSLFSYYLSPISCSCSTVCSLSHLCDFLPLICWLACFF